MILAAITKFRDELLHQYYWICTGHLEIGQAGIPCLVDF